eukprot:2090977-Pyramimonas_sp.AAC.1
MCTNSAADGLAGERAERSQIPMGVADRAMAFPQGAGSVLLSRASFAIAAVVAAKHPVRAVALRLPRGPRGGR